MSRHYLLLILIIQLSSIQILSSKSFFYTNSIITASIQVNKISKKGSFSVKVVYTNNSNNNIYIEEPFVYTVSENSKDNTLCIHSENDMSCNLECIDCPIELYKISPLDSIDFIFDFNDKNFRCLRFVRLSLEYLMNNSHYKIDSFLTYVDKRKYTIKMKHHCQIKKSQNSTHNKNFLIGSQDFYTDTNSLYINCENQLDLSFLNTNHLNLHFNTNVLVKDSNNKYFIDFQGSVENHPCIITLEVKSKSRFGLKKTIYKREFRLMTFPIMTPSISGFRSQISIKDISSLRQVELTFEDKKAKPIATVNKFKIIIKNTDGSYYLEDVKGTPLLSEAIKENLKKCGPGSLIIVTNIMATFYYDRQRTTPASIVIYVVEN
ncbi:MAG: hypothetical protein HN600_14685 [Bacteroidetes bacterium]|nr:hypothetical protein [Bacteroidota bacterium]MBT7827831.1 hypothetical protein [Bacteroidota bacterium]MBT7993382.1 hypothetical protein [Bacteroidota bacterium]